MSEKLPNVINFHITEHCNYKCTYCFAKFDAKDEFSLKDWMLATDRVSDYFKVNNLKGRINLAGGEPMVAPYLFDLIDYINSKDIDVSIITNGSRLRKDNIEYLSARVSMIGVSIDSIDHELNLEIGRAMGKKTLAYDELVSNLKLIKEKGIKLKVNTVVSKLNLHTDITKLYNDVLIDRVKLLQVKVNEGSNDAAFIHKITDDEFNNYVLKVKSKTASNLIIESNDDLENSYIIIDPKGDVISNNDDKHQIVGNILKDNFKDLIELSNFNQERFDSRYINE